MQESIRWIAMLVGAIGFAAAVNAAEGYPNLPPLSYVHAADVPSIPAQETPIVLVQADTAAATPTANFILNSCKETEHTTDPRSALRAVDPAGMLAGVLGNHEKRWIEPAEVKNIALLQATKHGKITTEIDNEGLTFYVYDPMPGYLGDDQAVFMAEFKGKRYKIVVNIKVLDVVVENLPVCPPPQLIKVTKPSSGASGYGSGYDLGTVAVTFADLAVGELGQRCGGQDLVRTTT